VPADADTDVVLGAKDLTNSGASAAESFDLLDDRAQPLGDRIGLLEPAHGVVVSKSERGHAAFAFVLAELERLQQQSRPIRVFSNAGETNSSAYRRPSGPDNLFRQRG